MLDVLLMLGQETTTNSTTAAPQQTGADPFMTFLLPMMLAMGVFMYLNWRGQKKDRQKFENMLNNLARNDRVQTIGGIFGTVVETRDDEIVLKVDETNNVKIRVHRNAIKEVSSRQAIGEPAAAAS